MDMSRQRGLPPKLGIKKRKPRASAVIESANGRGSGGRKDAAAAAAAAASIVAARPAGQPHLSKAQQAQAAKAAARAAAAAAAAAAAPVVASPASASASASVSASAASASASAPASASVAASSPTGSPSTATQRKHPASSNGKGKNGSNGNGAVATPAATVVDAEREAVKRKGLRHFAVRVSRKVEEKNITTYNEVADELVVEEKEIKRQEVEAGGKNAVALQKKLAKSGSLVDEKNIRRRVYDSLNVLMAMGIIEKDKKLISWRGLAMARGGGGDREAVAVRQAIEERLRVLEEKRAVFAELEEQATTLASLIRRNAKSMAGGSPIQKLNEASEHVGDGDPGCRGGDSGGGDDLAGGSKKESAAGAATLAGDVTDGAAPHVGAARSVNGTSGQAVASGDSNVTSDTTAKVASNSLASESGGAKEGSTATPVGEIGDKSSEVESASDKIPIPFIIVAAENTAQIELEMDDMREDVTFTFSSAFAVFDDREVLRRMNLSHQT